jgi:hypothetical protein
MGRCCVGCVHYFSHCDIFRERRIAYVLVWSTWGKSVFGRPRSRREDSVKIDHKERRGGDVGGIDLAHDTIK